MFNCFKVFTCFDRVRFEGKRLISLIQPFFIEPPDPGADPGPNDPNCPGPNNTYIPPMIVPTEGRATMKAYHEGKSIDEYLDDIWARRRHEWGHAPSSGGGWPYRSMDAIREASQSNVQPIKKRKS